MNTRNTRHMACAAGILCAFAAFVAIFSVANVIRAHGFGLSFEKRAGDFVVNVDINTFELTAQKPVRFEFGLWRANRTGSADFTDVLVRIFSPDGIMIFATYIHRPEYAPAGMVYTFPGEGNHELRTQFRNGRTTIAEAAFPIFVSEAVGRRYVPKEIIFWGVSALVAGILYFVWKKRKD